MDRQTLAHYGWIVVVALILAVMLALATPFGKYVMDGASSIASGYINASNEAMSEENKDKLVAEWEDKWTKKVIVGDLDNNGIIDVDDATIIVEIIDSGSANGYSLAAADVDNNKVVNEDDGFFLLYHINFPERYDNGYVGKEVLDNSSGIIIEKRES